jgi:hypothetical protein
VITTTSEKYRTQFGFAEEEVFGALDYLGIFWRRRNISPTGPTQAPTAWSAY